MAELRTRAAAAAAAHQNNNTDTLTANPLDNQPGEFDVIIARGRGAFKHPGNKRFRRLLAERFDAYSNATTKKSKSKVVSDIISQVRRIGNFVKQDRKTGLFGIASERAIREKIGQGLRDALHNEYKSSTKAKKRKRAAARQVQDGFMYALIAQNTEICEIMAEVVEHLSSDDNEMTDLFMQANVMILDELKASNLADAYSRAREEAEKKKQTSAQAADEEPVNSSEEEIEEDDSTMGELIDLTS